MDRTIKLIVTIKEPDDTCPEGSDVAKDIEESLAEVGYTGKAIVITEYDE